MIIPRCVSTGPLKFLSPGRQLSSPYSPGKGSLLMRREQSNGTVNHERLLSHLFHSKRIRNEDYQSQGRFAVLGERED
jgi:hypothetical protein